jgi:SNF2 family DNA or RNA helicase
MCKIDLNKIDALYKKVSYHKQHPELNLHEWQYALRRKYAEQSTFGIWKDDNIHPVFGDYTVRNPTTGNEYKVAIRDNTNSMNYCSCYDFKTNNLGTCKHIEAVLLRIKKNKRNARLLEKNYIPHYSSLYVDYRDNRSIKLRIGTENSEEFKELAREYFDDTLTLPVLNYDRFYEIYKKANSINPEFRCYQDVISIVVDHLSAVSRKRLINQKYRIDSDAFDEIINANLFPYQKEGVHFAAKAGRSLLADDMGLGKTIQAIAVTQLIKKEFGIEKVLIICPTSLKYQWKTEIIKFTGIDDITVIEGMAHKRPAQYNDNKLYKIVSYQTAANDIKVIEKMRPDFVILDEAQRIKNFKTKTSQAIKKIQSDYALVLTGTPLENRLEELFSIVQFIDPFVLGPFHEFLARHQIKDENGKIIGYRELNEIGQKLSDVMLRRTKKEVLSQLPDRMDKVLFVPMTEYQMDIHEGSKSMVAKLISKWRNFGFLSEKDRNRLMVSLNVMRMSCDSSYILDQETRHDTKVDELMNIIEEVDQQQTSKIVVFSQWERMTRIISQELDKKGIKYEYLHGGVPSKKREALFYNFNNDPEVKVFLSTDAGGTGLNLQAASYLVNVDLPWNPAVLEQRIARIHRLGQKNNVSIINLVSAGTIEHRMLDVLSFKSSMADGILDGGEDTIFMEDSKFSKFMSAMDDLIEPDTVPEQPASITVGEEELEEEKQETTPQPEEGQKQLDPHTEPDADKAFEEEEPKQKEPAEEENILSQGLKLLGKLSETLSDKEATRKLVSSVTEKDEKTGKTYLKIPVENEKLIENAVNLLGTFLQNLNK